MSQFKTAPKLTIPSNIGAYGLGDKAADVAKALSDENKKIQEFTENTSKKEINSEMDKLEGLRESILELMEKSKLPPAHFAKVVSNEYVEGILKSLFDQEFDALKSNTEIKSAMRDAVNNIVKVYDKMSYMTQQMGFLENMLDFVNASEEYLILIKNFCQARGI